MGSSRLPLTGLSLVGLLAASFFIACGPESGGDDDDDDNDGGANANCVPICRSAQAAAGDCFSTLDDNGLPVDVDCESFCAALGTIDVRGGCDDEADRVFLCASLEDDTCDAINVACESETESYNECLFDYCAANPDDAVCSVFGGS